MSIRIKTYVETQGDIFKTIYFLCALKDLKLKKNRTKNFVYSYALFYTIEIQNTHFKYAIILQIYRILNQIK